VFLVVINVWCFVHVAILSYCEYWSGSSLDQFHKRCDKVTQKSSRNQRPKTFLHYSYCSSRCRTYSQHSHINFPTWHNYLLWTRLLDHVAFPTSCNALMNNSDFTVFHESNSRVLCTYHLTASGCISLSILHLQLCTRFYTTCCRRRRISASIRTCRSSLCWTRYVPTSGNRCDRTPRCTAARTRSSWTAPSLCCSSQNHSIDASPISSDWSSTPSDNPLAAVVARP